MTATRKKKNNLQSRVQSAQSVQASHCRSASVCDQGYTTLPGFTIPSLKKSQGFGMTALKKSLLVNKCKRLGPRKYTEGML